MKLCAMVLIASACLRTSSLACWSAVLCTECRITSSRYESTVPLCTRTVCMFTMEYEGREGGGKEGGKEGREWREKKERCERWVVLLYGNVVCAY